jgi:hypothetical protein
MRIQIVTVGLLAADSAFAQITPVNSAPHNVVRNMAALAREGVYLVNSHSVFPTFPTANATAIATARLGGQLN